ncbi:hypothetical protein BJ170DRAFT_308376 [Xylariales sp. AK1849]|nr:hypothetical protein BJ170DRAFT_308376 [Xylariales sp. AK1849]
MIKTDLDIIRFCLQGVFWSGLLFTSSLSQTTTSGASLTELLVVSSLNKNDLATRTVTITIAYKPSIFPGNGRYLLAGCYGHTGLDGQGLHPFGKEDNYASPSSVDAKNLTVPACLDGCSSLKLPNRTTTQFTYVGLKNGSECYCGTELASTAEKLTADDCEAPCSGTSKLSCGGEDNLAVYTYITTSQKKPAVSSDINLSSSTDDASASAGGEQSAPIKLPPPSEPSPPPERALATTATVAAISGSMSGAVIIAACMILCFRAYKRKKKLQNAHVANMLDKRTRPPSLIATNADAHNDVRLTVGGDLVPTTPALEQGDKHTFTLSPNGPRSAPAVPDGDIDSLFLNLMGQVLTQPQPQPTIPTLLPPSEGASSAVQWRILENATNPSSPKIVSPPPSARFDGLGDRAWHRRRLSTPYAPPPSIPLPPVPPRFVKMNKIPRAPVRPSRASAATFEVGGIRPVSPEVDRASCGSGSTEGVRPTAPLNIRKVGGDGYGMSSGIVDGDTGAMNVSQIFHTNARQPTIPILPQTTPDERFKFDSKGWESETARGGDRREVNGDGASPDSASTVGTSILDSLSFHDEPRLPFSPALQLNSPTLEDNSTLEDEIMKR